MTVSLVVVLAGSWARTALRAALLGSAVATVVELVVFFSMAYTSEYIPQMVLVCCSSFPRCGAALPGGCRRVRFWPIVAAGWYDWA